MNLSSRDYKCILMGLFLIVGILLSRNAAAQDDPPLSIHGPRLSPPVSPHSNVADNHQIYNDLIVKRLTPQSRTADITNKGQPQEQPGRGIRQIDTGLSSGLTLYTQANVCNDFNNHHEWRSHTASLTDVWSDYYAGWGAYAFDDKRLYRANNVIFSMEQSIGPGHKFGPNQYAIKIASHQPFAAGLGSPIITAPAGSEVMVSVKYMIFDHDTHGQDYDWASLGIKPDADGIAASYVNGYLRGQWTELTNIIKAGTSGKIMVLIQGQSPAALNSNIYFDDIKVAINGIYLPDCTFQR